MAPQNHPAQRPSGCLSRVPCRARRRENQPLTLAAAGWYPPVTCSPGVAPARNQVAPCQLIERPRQVGGVSNVDPLVGVAALRAEAMHIGPSRCR